MKKQKYLIFLIIFSFLPLNIVFAENGNPNPPPSTLSNSQKSEAEPLNKPLIPKLIQQEIEKVRENQTNRANLNSENTVNSDNLQQVGTTTNTLNRQVNTNQARERRTEQIRKHLKNISERFQALIQREYQIKSRIQSRIGKLEETGFDVPESKKLLAQFAVDFENLKNQIDLMKDEISQTIESSDLDGLFERVREQTQNLKTVAQNAHTKLVQTVSQIRAEIGDSRQTTDNSSDSESE